ncbi:MAG: four helix bundle protein [bacterium]
MTEFKKFKIWQKGMDLVLLIYELSKKLPNDEKYAIRSQITRAAFSIPSNIAEGSSRSSQKELKRFLEIALGSAYELETQLLCIQKLELLNDNHINEILIMLNEEQKMINSFMNKLKSNI